MACGVCTTFFAIEGVGKDELRLSGTAAANKVIVAGSVGFLLDLAWPAEKENELTSLRASAYATIAEFAPWNVGYRYAQIVFTQGNAHAAQFAEQQQRQTEAFRSFACRIGGISGSGDPCTPPESPHGIRAFFLSAHVPFILRPITGFFDLLLHALTDQGGIGFLVATTQIALGALLTRIAVRRGLFKLDALYLYVVGIPLAVLGLGSLAALPLWLLAFMGVAILKGLPGAGLGAQFGGTGYLARWFASWFGRKAAEEFGHASFMKQIKRLIRD